MVEDWRVMKDRRRLLHPRVERRGEESYEGIEGNFSSRA